MATSAALRIRVTSSRGASRIDYSTKGRYVSLPVNGIADVLARQPILPTSSAPVFWQAVLALVTNDLAANEASAPSSTT